jgi:dUTP pyrophosphatase
METLRLKLLRAGAKPPARATGGSAGYDLFACLDAPEALPPGETRVIPTGVAIALERGFAAFVYARSGLGVRHGVVPANCVGVVDSDYRGDLLVGLINQSKKPYTVEPGERVAQLVLARCETPELAVVEELDGTERGTGGFGSTGKQ